MHQQPTSRFITLVLLVFWFLFGFSCNSLSPTDRPGIQTPSSPINSASSTISAAEIPPTISPVSDFRLANPLPPQGLYESCLPTDTSCLDRLEEMGKKGFRIVLNDGLRYAYTLKSILAYADKANSLGMQVILPIKYSPEWDTDPRILVKNFPELAQECGSDNNKSFLACYVGILKDHPALWGYYIADEVHPEFSSGLQVYAAYVKTLDPFHPRLIVEEGSNDPMEVFFTFHSKMASSADILGIDYYPYGYRETFKQISKSTGASARMGQRWADYLGLKYAMVLQAYAMPQYYGLTNPLCMPWPFCATFPTYDQMKAQRDQVLLNSHPEILLWFSYPDILRSDHPAEHWKDLIKAAFSPYPNLLETHTPSPASQTCALGWTCNDVGFPLLEGTQNIQDGSWTVSASGWDIRSTYFEKADQFRFIWQDIPADGELAAKVVDQTGSDFGSKMGVMMRKTFDPTSPFFAILVTPWNDIQVRYRKDYNQDPVDLVSIRQKTPVLLKILRNGTVFQAATSLDGVIWEEIPGSKMDLSIMQGTLMGGVAVTSGNVNRISTAIFDNVELTEKGK
jgi:hypothetical protein